MDFRKNVNNSPVYTQEGLTGKWVKRLLLIISTIIFPLMTRYGVGY